VAGGWFELARVARTAVAQALAAQAVADRHGDRKAEYGHHVECPIMSNAGD